MGCDLTRNTRGAVRRATDDNPRGSGNQSSGWESSPESTAITALFPKDAEVIGHLEPAMAHGNLRIQSGAGRVDTYTNLSIGFHP
jgi:hypothetical protein